MSPVKMFFDLLANLFGFIDGLTRKRPAAEDAEYSDDSYDEYVSPAKKHCCDHYNLMNNGNDIIELEGEEDDDLIICDDKTFNNSARSVATSGRRRSISIEHQKNSVYPTKNRNQSSFNNNYSMNIKPSQFYGKHLLNSKFNSSRLSTLSRTHQLQEKEQYSKLLQSFLPRGIQILHPKSECRRSQKPVEVIDVENDTTVSSLKDQEVFSTPKLTTPSRYFTPMGKIWAKPSSRRMNSIEEIRLDGDDDSYKSANGSVSSRLKKPSAIPKAVTPKEVTTNTLRDKLSAKEVLNKDFIPRISGQYNERIEQKCREAEELKKATHMLSTRNRMAREVSLEQHLSRSMKLYEEILVEDSYDEEEVLPELADSMLIEVKEALSLRPGDQVLVEAFGLRITRKDIHTLAGLNWLNDEVINFYMNLLIARGDTDKYPSVYAMNTFFYPKLLSGGHSSLKRWTRKVDIFAKDLVVVPIHLGMHWCMSIIDFRDKSIRYYDSMGGSNSKCLTALRKYLEDESMDKKKKSYDTSDWTLESMRDIPQQMNGSDCGVFSCTFAEFICANRKLTFTQDDMPYFRNKMVYEILHVKLLS